MSSKTHGFTDRVALRLGRFITGRPWLVLSAAFLLAMGAASGGLVACAVLLGCFADAAIAQHAVSGRSSTCGPIAGESRQDMENVKRFCDQGIPDGIATGAYGMEMLLWVKVNRAMANQMLADRLTAEQVVLNWMKGWKAITGSRVVTIHVEWGDVEIAEGQTTVFSGDKVTFRR